MITYQVGVEEVDGDELDGFFDGWPSAPDSAALLRILQNSAWVALAYDGGRVIGFVNVLSDGELAAYIALLEVRATHRGRGVGTELVRRAMRAFENVYMIDAVCDAEVAPFYERLGMVRLTGMAHRNRHASVLGGGP